MTGTASHDERNARYRFDDDGAYQLEVAYLALETINSIYDRDGENHTDRTRQAEDMRAIAHDALAELRYLDRKAIEPPI